jgi:hypothetical protein
MADHPHTHVSELLDGDNYQRYLDELEDENAPAAVQLEAWLREHREHRRLTLEWWKHAGSTRWFVNGQCRTCRVASFAVAVGDDEAPDVALPPPETH